MRWHRIKLKMLLVITQVHPHRVELIQVNFLLKNLDQVLRYPYRLLIEGNGYWQKMQNHEY